ncbi:MAG TPA: single-stranded DNA-binding protein [Ktedonobacteraceae bacterium]|nr:single-stranded DNA-binding protein [Ktedonobacteraceae bacterium]
MVSKVTLIGRLGKDPDFSMLSDGTSVAKFSLAVGRYSKVKGERKEETDWYNIVAWRKLAETCEKFLHKGSKVYIEGRLELRKYVGNDGVQRVSVDVIANDMQMLDPKDSAGGSGNYSERGSGSNAPSYGSAPAPAGDDFDPFLDSDDLP